jgi:SPP1 family phage portal protein
MDIKQIQKLIAADSGRCRKIEEQRKYAGGYNVAILGRRAHEEPDARIPIPIARKGIRLTSGYMVKPGNVVYSTEDGYAEDTLQPIFDANDEQLTTQEEFETALTHGQAWEYHYTKDNEPRFVQVPTEQCIPIWDDSLPPKLEGMIRYYKHFDMDGEEECEVYVYDNISITKYTGKEYSSLKLAIPEPAHDGEPAEPNPMQHGYGEVPFVQAKIAKDCSNLFDCVIPIIDIEDRTLSEDYANEAQRFANSYMRLRNKLSHELDEFGMSEVDKIKITRIFEDLGDDADKAVTFLTKEIQTDFIKLVADTFERLIYDMMQIINPNDIAATGQISGIALAYKLLQFEYFCASCEAYFSRALQWRIRLIQNVTGNMKAKPQDRPQVDIQFRRNLPFDMASAVDQFVKVAGILPDEVALKLFPADFMPNPEEIAAKMQEEKDARAQFSMDAQIPTEPVAQDANKGE